MIQQMTTESERVQEAFAREKAEIQVGSEKGTGEEEIQ